MKKRLAIFGVIAALLMLAACSAAAPEYGTEQTQGVPIQQRSLSGSAFGHFRRLLAVFPCQQRPRLCLD